jgi:hypothetical protein
MIVLLGQFLVTPGMDVVDGLVSRLRVEDMSDVCSDLSTIFEVHGQTRRLIQWAVRKELAATTSALPFPPTAACLLCVCVRVRVRVVCVCVCVCVHVLCHSCASSSPPRFVVGVDALPTDWRGHVHGVHRMQAQGRRVSRGPAPSVRPADMQRDQVHGGGSASHALPVGRGPREQPPAAGGGVTGCARPHLRLGELLPRSAQTHIPHRAQRNSAKAAQHEVPSTHTHPLIILGIPQKCLPTS